jgi:hypothetical protein
VQPWPTATNHYRHASSSTKLSGECRVYWYFRRPGGYLLHQSFVSSASILALGLPQVPCENPNNSVPLASAAVVMSEPLPVIKT